MVVLQINSDTKQDQPNKWIVILSISGVVLLVMFLLGLEYWMAHTGEKLGFLATLSAPIYAFLHLGNTTVKSTTSLVTDGTVAMFKSTT
jgi:hypothetical protein